MTDPIAEFRTAIAGAGIPVPEQIKPDGKFHRFGTNGKSRDDAGWYFLHLDGVPAGAFGCLRSGISEKWKANGRDFTPEERRQYAKRMDAARRQRKAAEQQRHADAAAEAARIWKEAKTGDHDYLKRKGIKAHGARVHNGRLVIPMRDAGGNLASLQFIAADGGKKFLTGGKVTGTYCAIGKPKGVLCIAEGYATAASIHEATGHAVACAFNAGNLKAVAKGIRAKLPDVRIIICGDNDLNNTGQTAATDAAKATGSRIAIPEAPGDWNDVHATDGADAVRAGIDGSGDEHTLKPLCDPSDLGIGEFLDREPTPRVWILHDLLPLGIVGLLAAGGGTGKSFLTLQLAVSVATGRPFLGITVSDPGSVLLLCAEDERDEIHRRLWRIVEALRECEQFTDTDDELLRERLFIASRVGDDNLLTSIVDGVAIRTSIGARIQLTADLIPALKLIVLDPVSRFRGGDENNNEHATRFVEAVETLRARTGATVLMPHHMSKDGLRAGADRLSPESLRGASALLDAVRWAGGMATLRKDAAKEYGIEPEEAGRYVRLDVVKNNYAAPWDGMWLRRERGGILCPVSMPTRREQKTEQKGEDRYRDTLPKLKGLIEQEQQKGQPLTRRRLRDFAGMAGMFKMSDQTLRGVLERAIAEGAIKAHPIPGGKNGAEELRTW